MMTIITAMMTLMIIFIRSSGEERSQEGTIGISNHRLLEDFDLDQEGLDDEYASLKSISMMQC